MRIALLTTDNREDRKDYGHPVPYFGSAPEALLEGFSRCPEVEVHVVSCAQARMRSPAKLAPNIWFHHLYVPRLGWLKTGYLGCIRAVRRRLREIRPDLVHGQGTERDCAISAAFSGLPSILTIHGNMRLIAQVNQARPFSRLWLAALLEKFTVARSVGVICITRHTQRAVTGLARRTWVVPNAVGTSFFEVNPRRAPGVPAPILCVANICQLKNQHALIRALEPLAARHPLELRFCGDAPAGDGYAMEFLKMVHARPWCRYDGTATRDELRGFLQQAALLVLPSLEDNCPMAVLEAMAAGVPVVAARVGGLPDLIEDGQTGFFCDPLQPASMAAAVERVLLDPDAAAGVAHRARQRARERFHCEVIARQHLNVYTQLKVAS